MSVRVHAGLFDIGHHADDLSIRLIPLRAAFSYLLPDRVFIGPLASSKAVIHDRDQLCVVIVRFAEEPSGQQRHLHRFEVTGNNMLDAAVGISTTDATG